MLREEPCPGDQGSRPSHSSSPTRPSEPSFPCHVRCPACWRVILWGESLPKICELCPLGKMDQQQGSGGYLGRGGPSLLPSQGGPVRPQSSLTPLA